MKLLSIIIPTLNEENYLEATVSALRDRAVSQIPQEIIVVDGGSEDGTQNIAKKLEVMLLVREDMPEGRAFLLNHGAAQAQGDVFLFLDADSLVPQGYDADIIQAFNNDRIVGGAFEFALDGPQFGLRVVEVMNRLRYHIWPHYYGDQGVFVDQKVFEELGGYPPRRIMESSDLCKKLLQRGRLKIIPKPLFTSPRRFLEGGIYRVLGFDFKIWCLDFLGRPTEDFAAQYWQNNKHRKKEVV